MITLTAIRNSKLWLVLVMQIYFFTLYAQKGSYIETNGVKIYYETYGQGDPLLLLHGFTLSSKSWEPWVEVLAKNHQLIIPDLRGHGNSTNPSKEYTAKMSAIDMLGLLDHLKVESIKAIGHSNGAVVLLHMATMDSLRLSSMILISGAPYIPTQAKGILGAMTYETSRAYMEPLHPRGEEQIKMLLKQMRGLADNYDDANFSPPYLATIKCPTLIIHGDADPILPIEMPLISYRAIPHSFLWVVPNSGHFPAGIYSNDSIWSDVLFKVIEEFIGGKWKR